MAAGQFDAPLGVDTAKGGLPDMSRGPLRREGDIGVKRTQGVPAIDELTGRNVYGAADRHCGRLVAALRRSCRAVILQDPLKGSPFHPVRGNIHLHIQTVFPEGENAAGGKDHLRKADSG